MADLRRVEVETITCLRKDAIAGCIRPTKRPQALATYIYHHLVAKAISILRAMLDNKPMMIIVVSRSRKTCLNKQRPIKVPTKSEQLVTLNFVYLVIIGVAAHSRGLFFIVNYIELQRFILFSRLFRQHYIELWKHTYCKTASIPVAQVSLIPIQRIFICSSKYVTVHYHAWKVYQL